MGYIKEPKGVDFVMDPTPLTEADRQMISQAFAIFKSTGKITRAKTTRKSRQASKRIKRDAK